MRDGWVADYADGGSFLGTLLDGRNLRPTGNVNRSYFDDPETNRRIDAANALTGEARRKAWADLDVHLMRNEPSVGAHLAPDRPRLRLEELRLCRLQPALRHRRRRRLQERPMIRRLSLSLVMLAVGVGAARRGRSRAAR